MEQLKKRLDVLLHEKGWFDSRERAKRSIMAGAVFVEGLREDKPGSRFDENALIEIRYNTQPYVSRGGFKLEKALKEFRICIKGFKTLDVGASTGGFTDCMLKNGAQSVIAIDVGYGQIAWKLRKDSRVTVMDRTNIRYVKPSELPYAADFAAVDVSFISLRLVVPVVKKLLHSKGEMVCLIKPQFEAGRQKVGKKGVVRDSSTHIEVMHNIMEIACRLQFAVKGITYSPVKGPEGNIEYLIHMSKKTETESVPKETAERTVLEAHRML